MSNNNASKQTHDKQSLPEMFRPLFWSYRFASLDLERNKKTIIVQTVNYGDLNHWRWLTRHYGKAAVKETLERIPVTEVRPRAARLAGAVFGAKFSHAPRGTH